MEKDFFVTCHGLSFSRRFLSKGFQAVQEKECIIYDIFVAGSGYFDMQITFSPATTTLCYFGGNLAFEVSWFGQLVVSPCEIWEKIFSKLVLIPNPALPLIALLSVNPCKVILSFKKFLN